LLNKSEERKERQAFAIGVLIATPYPKLFDIGNKDFEFRLLKTVLLPLCSCCWDQPLEQIEFVMNNNGMLLADQDLEKSKEMGLG